MTFLFFLIVLPSWVQLRWKSQQPMFSLGLRCSPKKSFFNCFLRGFCFSFALVLLILVPISFSPWVVFQFNITTYNLLNSIFLGILVGFTEELIFRGWLFGEIEFLVRTPFAFVLQAVLFSLIHVFAISQSGIGFLEIISLLIGLFFLGILLAIRRVLDNGSLWGCIGLHGGLVGLWFFINSSLITIGDQAPAWLVGPGSFSPNPLGSFMGLFYLILILLFYRKAFAIAGFPFNGARRDSSKDAIP